MWNVGSASSIAQAPSAPPLQQERPTLASIERNYQVRDDDVANWSPKLFGAIPVGTIGGERNLTVSEGRLLDRLTFDRGIAGLQRFSNAADAAFTVADANQTPPTTLPARVEADIARLPPAQQAEARAQWPRNDGHNDAFRHAYWSATLTREFGANWTREFTTAHEARPGNPGMREAMDLYNNEVGRRIATDNPNANPVELARLVNQAVTDGRLVVVDQNGRLAWSNTVRFGEHGISAPTAEPGVIGVPADTPSAR